MNSLIIFACALTLAAAAPFEGPQTVDVTQDTLGNYNFAVKTADLYRVEERTLDGNVVGEYSYPDANGVLRTVKYTSGKDGFQVLEGLPIAPVDISVPVAEGPELIAARNEHLSLLNLPVATPEVRFVETAAAPIVAAVPELPSVSSFSLPVQGVARIETVFAEGIPLPVDDTPEVKAAKAEHFAAHAAARGLVL